MVAKNSSPASEPHPGAEGLWKTFLASAAVCVLGLVGLVQVTANGNAFTTETLRRAQVVDAPVLVPDLPIDDAQGQRSTLRTLLATDRRVWIVDFVYIRCQTLCLTLGSVFQQLQQQIIERGLQARVGLLSVSFDPANDDPASMGAYRDRMGMDPAVWRMVTLSSPRDRQALLDGFGIIVIPAPLGEFEHNAALHLVTSAGMLVQILDYDDANLALQAAMGTKP